MAPLTRHEKNAIRNMPCGRCNEAPPFENGDRCHVHRIVAGIDGGTYEHGNAVPRCASCHDIEHGGTGLAPLIAAASSAGRLGGARRTASMSKEQLSAAMRSARSHRRPETLRAGGLAMQAKHPGTSRLNGLANIGRLIEARARKSAEWRTDVSRKGGLAVAAKRTPMERSACARKAGKIGGKVGPREPKSRTFKLINHTRWHIRRGVVSPDCTLCYSEARL